MWFDWKQADNFFIILYKIHWRRSIQDEYRASRTCTTQNFLVLFGEKYNEYKLQKSLKILRLYMEGDSGFSQSNSLRIRLKSLSVKIKDSFLKSKKKMFPPTQLQRQRRRMQCILFSLKKKTTKICTTHPRQSNCEKISTFGHTWHRFGYTDESHSCCVTRAHYLSWPQSHNRLEIFLLQNKSVPKTAFDFH